MKYKLNWKHITWLGCIIILIGVLGGASLHNSHVHHYKMAGTNTVTVTHNPYINYNNKMSHYRYDTNLHLKNKASSALIMDAKNGNILYHKHINQERYVASVGKLMTLYLVQYKANKLHAWNHRVHISKPVRNLSYDTKDGLGGFEFQKKHHYTVKDLYKAAVIGSSNNSAIALGQWVAGSNKNFIHLMNLQSATWHLHSHFVSASGLESDDLRKFHLNMKHNYHGANKLSALDVAIIARHLIHAYPQTLNYSKQPQAYVDNQFLHNVNGLLKGRPFYNHKLHVVGLKSGYTQRAGLNFVAYDTPKGSDPILAITLNDNQQFVDLQKMLLKTQKSSQLLP